MIKKQEKEKRTVQPGDAFDRYRFQVGVWNCQILNHVVEPQLFTSWWNRYHQWLSGFELIQKRDFFSFLIIPELSPVSLLEKRIVVWSCHGTCRHRKKTIFTSTVHVRNLLVHGFYLLVHCQKLRQCGMGRELTCYAVCAKFEIALVTTVIHSR